MVVVGVLRYFYTNIGSGHVFGFQILNFNIFGCFQKNDEYEDFVDNFWGHHKIGNVFRGHSYAFRVFS